MEWLTTSTILQDLRDPGNDAAWQALVERFRRPIIGMARRSGLSGEDAEDVAQDSLLAFADAFRRGQFDREKGRLSAWLFSIARHHVLRHREKVARRAASSARRAAADGPTATAVEDHGLRQFWEDALWESCAAWAAPQFEPQTYRAFELVVRDGLTPDEAAQTLRVNVQTVYNAKHRVLSRLRALRDDLDMLTPSGNGL
jgi:RNA polymerase sigma factor (sigma-70 family)